MRARKSYFWGEAQFDADTYTVSWKKAPTDNTASLLRDFLKDLRLTTDQHLLCSILSVRAKGDKQLLIVPNPKFFDPDTFRHRKSPPLKRDQLNDNQKQIFDNAIEKFSSEFALAKRDHLAYLQGKETNLNPVQEMPRNNVSIDDEYQQYFGEQISSTESELRESIEQEARELQAMMAKPISNDSPIPNWMSSWQSSKRANTTSSEQMDKQQFWRAVEFKPPGIITWQSSKFNKDAMRYIREFLNENEELGNQFQLELIASNHSETAHIELQPSQSFLSKNPGTQINIKQFAVLFALYKMQMFEESSDSTSTKRQKLP